MHICFNLTVDCISFSYVYVIQNISVTTGLPGGLTSKHLEFEIDRMRSCQENPRSTP